VVEEITVDQIDYIAKIKSIEVPEDPSGQYSTLYGEASRQNSSCTAMNTFSQAEGIGGGRNRSCGRDSSDPKDIEEFFHRGSSARP
jgi:hypothetical protein